MARNYRRGPKWLPGVIAEVKGPLSYVDQMKGGALWRRYVDQLRNGVANTQSDDIPLVLILMTNLSFQTLLSFLKHQPPNHQQHHPLQNLHPLLT